MYRYIIAEKLSEEIIEYNHCNLDIMVNQLHGEMNKKIILHHVIKTVSYTVGTVGNTLQP